MKILALVVLSLFFPLIMEASDPVTHTLSWGPWDGRFDTDSIENIQVIWDGKPLGTIFEAYPQLCKMPFSVDDVVRINIPASTVLSKKHRPIYWCAKFISVWNERRVRLKYFQNDKEYIVHTITYSNYKTIPGAIEDNFKNAHLLFDQKDMGLIEEGIKELDSREWQKDTIIQFLPPVYRALDIAGNLGPKSFYDFLNKIENDPKLIVENVSAVE